MTHPQNPANGRKVYEALAEAFAAEGITHNFVLMGDGNMHWATTLEGLGIKTIYARHEHCAVSMAMAHAEMTNGISCASVTCGPGLTQIMTALVAAVRAHLPVVVFAGESPFGSFWYNQELDQAPFVAATGARYVPIRNPKLLHAQLQDAFVTARAERRPVVVAMPLDLQQQAHVATAPYRPSTDVIPAAGRFHPDPDAIEVAARMINAAKRPIVLAGRGAKLSGAASDCVLLADRIGALLAETLPVRGLFHDHAFNLGVAGGFSGTLTRATFADADLVIAVGASLTHHTRDGGKLYPNARVVQIDQAPSGLNQGTRVCDFAVRADARSGTQALAAAIGEDPPSTSGWRNEKLSRGLVTAPQDDHAFEGPLNGLDPREVVAVLDEVIPKDWHVVNSSGHCSYYTSYMRGRKAEHFHTVREFGAIGNGLSYAIGVAADADRPVVLFDGDGGLLMHIQELETIRRHGLKVLICVLNDGAYGSEIHKLRSDGLSDAGSVFGRGDLGAVARSFELRGEVVTGLGGLREKLRAFAAGSTSELWDIHISDVVMSRAMRSAHPPRAMSH